MTSETLFENTAVFDTAINILRILIPCRDYCRDLAYRVSTSNLRMIDNKMWCTPLVSDNPVNPANRVNRVKNPVKVMAETWRAPSLHVAAEDSIVKNIAKRSSA
jgi:hypothetical protein